MVIYVGNLRSDTTAQHIREVFQHCGQVSDVRVMVDPVSHRGLGFAFVYMPDGGQALRAIRRLHHTRLRDRAVIVCPAPQRPDRRHTAQADAAKVS